ncbi:MAG: DUF3526 domain-containing protein [Polyangiaceae bacterium]|nr:DUF3526 domain-containing protein [Polyangiaceae bacterium]MCW5791239.1 DUF3526 domain-containing protein [Polyangiaceae bacterium]
MLKALVIKELLEIRRDGRSWILGVAVLGLLFVALAFSFAESRALRAELAHATHQAEEDFLNQDDKNPHVAAHYGTYVFKPASALRFINPGVDAFVGSAIKLEAHRRGAASGARAQDGTALSRLGRLSVAAVVELLLPLVIIGVGFSAFTGERERGTLRQLASMGVMPRTLLLGKLLAQVVAIGALLLPAGLALIAASIMLASERGSLTRLLLLLGLYAAHALTWMLLTLWASARVRSSRSALVLLLGLWVVSALVVPRLGASATTALVRTPSTATLAAEVAESLERGLPGGEPKDDRVGAWSEQLLERYGFAGAETLMDASLLSGIELMAEARFENEVIDHHFGAFEAQVVRQERVGQAFGVLSPILSVRSVAMALAGTDAAHHRHFSGRAEQHRRALVERLNHEFAERGGEAGFDYRAGREVWETAPRFAYQPPSARAALRGQLISAGLALLWLVLSAWLAVRATARIQVV